MMFKKLNNLGFLFSSFNVQGFVSSMYLLVIEHKFINSLTKLLNSKQSTYFSTKGNISFTLLISALSILSKALLLISGIIPFVYLLIIPKDLEIKLP